MTERHRLLDLAAACSFTIALLHVVTIFVGAPAYRYLGVGRYAEMAEQGSSVPAIVTAGITGVFLLFGLYALSGAERIRPLPLLRGALWIIAGIYTLRGLVVAADVIALIRGVGYPVRQAVFSGISLAIGLVHIFGTAELSEDDG